MQYLVISHPEYNKDLRTVIHHGDLEPDQITYVEASNLYNAAEAAHKEDYRDRQDFIRYRMIVIPLSGSKAMVMEFTVDPPGGAVIKPAKSTPKTK